MRRSTLTLAVLLMGIFLANVAGAEENDLLLQITSPTPNMTSATPDCKTALLPLGTPEPTRATITQMCGSCSPDAFCRGIQINTPCGDGGMTCNNTFSQVCLGEPLYQNNQCYCSHGQAK